MTTFLTIVALLIAAVGFGLWIRESRRRQSLQRELEERQTELEDVRREARNRIDRAERDARRREREATWESVETLLPAIDSLESAVRQDLDETESSGGSSASLGEGLAMTIEQFETGLSTLGIERIHPSPGDDYQADTHEALHVKSSDADDEDDEEDEKKEEPSSTTDWQIYECIRSGYRSDERVLRPAGVVVETRDEPVQQPTDEPPEQSSEEQTLEAAEEVDGEEEQATTAAAQKADSNRS